MTRPSSSGDPRQTEAMLLDEMLAQQKAYYRAAAEHKKAINALRAGHIEPNLDGSQLLHSLAVSELRALELYSETVKAFANAVRRRVEPSPARDKPAHEVAVVAEAHITPRERQVLALIASGKSSRQIAVDLGMAFKTVVVHRYHLQTKLNAHNTAELTKAALRMGLIEL